MNNLVAKYFEEKEGEGCWGGKASNDTRRAVNDFAVWLESAQQKRAVDSPEPCGDYTPAFLIPGSPCLNCDADAASH